MIRPSLPERIAIKLARLIAGRERRRWLDAMEAELDYLPTHRLDWALGTLVAAVKDRLARDRLALASLVVLPAGAAVAVLPVTALAMAVVEATGLSMGLLGPVLFPVPLLFAVLLGASRAWRRPLMAGLLGFLVYQAGPSAFFHFAWGSEFGLWAPNLAHYGIHPAVSVAGVFASWGLGAVAGTRLRRRRISPPSP